MVKSLGESLENTFCGEISRLELRNLMTRPELFIMKSDFSATVRSFTDQLFIIPRPALWHGILSGLRDEAWLESPLWMSSADLGLACLDKLDPPTPPPPVYLV